MNYALGMKQDYSRGDRIVCIDAGTYVDSGMRNGDVYTALQVHENSAGSWYVIVRPEGRDSTVEMYMGRFKKVFAGLNRRKK